MKTKLSCLCLLLALLSAGSNETAAGGDIYVPDDFATIQEAIDAAVDGDTVIVRPGTYRENITFLGKAITVKSIDGPESTVIEGHERGHSVVTFDRDEDLDSVLDGYTLTNGEGTCREPDTFIVLGGGIYCYSSSPTIINNIISGNGIWDYPWLWDDYGGGICCWSEYNPPMPCSPLIRNNIISNNFAIDGGGISCDGDLCAPTITGNIITGNQACYGGGLSCSSEGIIANNIIARNIALGDGGGIYLIHSSTEIENCTVSQNSAIDNGGGLYNDNQAHTPPPLITNTVFWNNSAPTSPEIESRNSLLISYCDIKGGWPGTGNIDADPLFVDPGTGDLHLSYGSPCRDGGNRMHAGIFDTDFEGDPRIHEKRVDIGADEFHRHLYFTGYSMPGSAVEIKIVGQPGTSEVTLCLGSGIQDPPRPTQFGDLFLLAPLLARIPLGPIPEEGLLVYPATIPDSFVLGEHYPFQALIGPKAPGSHLTNLMVLTTHLPLPPFAWRRW